jgi:putative SbcD/Mre11-related phosphoesterase
MATTKLVPLKPALLIEGEKRHLVITDTHIGFEANFAHNKIFVGKNTILNEMLGDIFSIVESYKPDDIILLGDVKSGIERITKNEWNDVPKFLQELQEKIDVIIIPGNHDANIQKLIPEGVNLTNSTGMVIENILLTHGHVMPSENVSYVDKIIIGHVHPVFFDENSVLNGKQVWVSIKAKKDNIFPSRVGQVEIIIVPSFNRYFYATKKKHYKKSISPIIEKLKFNITAKIATLDGIIIGDESHLHQII